MWTEVVRSGQMLARSKAESTGFADSLDVEYSKKWEVRINLRILAGTCKDGLLLRSGRLSMQQPLSPLSCWVWGHHHISTSLLSPFVSLPLSPRDTFQPPASWTVGFWCPLNHFLGLHDALLPGVLTSLGLHSILHNHSFQQPPDGRSVPQTFPMDAPDTASKRTPPLCAAPVLANSSYLHHHSIIMPDFFPLPHSTFS